MRDRTSEQVVTIAPYVKIIREKRTRNGRCVSNKYLLFDKVVVIVLKFRTPTGERHYVRVRPKYWFRDRALTPWEHTEVAHCLINMAGEDFVVLGKGYLEKAS